MSATAKLLKDLGWEVGGSDEECYPPASDYLISQKIPFVTGYDAKNIPANADIIVIGRNAKLSPETNEEVRAAIESGKTIKSFPEVLGEITKDKENIVVAGSYGKSTCTALFAWCLMNAGKDPGYFIGAIPVQFEESSRIGKSKIFILEGDEYPTSHTDPRPKFAHLHPQSVLLTSADHDHVNVYPILESYLKPFEDLLKKNNGLIAAGIDNPHVSELIAPYPNRAITYGLSGRARWSAQNIKFGETTAFKLTKDSEVVINLETKLLGRHNVENIVGVSALILEKGLLTKEELAAGVKTFLGIKRRLDLKTEKSSILIYEGFGSSYEKARSAIEAIKLHFPDRRLVILFEPHTFSWRNRAAITWYDSVFEGADKVFIGSPAEQGAQTHDQLSQEEIVERARRAGVSAEPLGNQKDALSEIRKNIKPENVLLILTSGNLGGLIQPLIKMAEENFPIPTPN